MNWVWSVGMGDGCVALQSSMHFLVMMNMHRYCEGRQVRKWASEEAI